MNITITSNKQLLDNTILNLTNQINKETADYNTLQANINTVAGNLTILTTRFDNLIAALGNKYKNI